MTDESQQSQCSTRRCVLLGAGVLGAAGVLTACSTAPVPYDESPEGGGVQSAPATLAPGAPTPAATGAPKLLAQASAIPVGGGMAFTNQMVVVTQPTQGQFKGFTAVCTHVGCICNVVENGTINCPCHGSKFKITDGSVVTGPAPAPLGTVPITVMNGNVYMG